MSDELKLINVKIINESAKGGFTLEVRPGAYIKSERSIIVNGELSPEDEETLRKIILKKLKEDFKLYRTEIVG